MGLRERIQDALNDVDYPLSKEALVEHVERRGADPEVVRAVRACPLGDYANLTEVMGAVPLDPAPERTAGERAEQARHGPKRVAQHERDIGTDREGEL
ncbi:Protein of unknown function (DUF2795) [Streptoalloteichus tenebrarius]|uniref:DUF2795 domain-containing protein n=1 Tax=Streptoalloteichus tenebrarius (strain ATCC 17920 / DSM 40477 / JCM 4838 / CBS 697.72 / NBRC 16177 / NCIMB 11028 / NRRL B-12390 / A12253. 1 / ISP 5477) TaxID=1933 RepID=A0ABT1HYV8_STRSD|nr:DUF2795 domain-containing protein [Streptoalloteichus tenebrarius]MCP2260714.1 Protein of unknown function (DUF2795) [Streptoalloteichus tenebrarius]BFF03752.1 hypothetical protein GCM10020241_54270 [Streptoalloteichus tenebrarius]